VTALPEEILNLPVEERLRLVEDLRDSIREHPESLLVSDQQREELDRRLQEHQRDPQTAESLEVVLKRLARRV
jgi:putative addiction module component (TIGR02574 family)